jgi:hypothetical protein
MPERKERQGEWKSARNAAHPTIECELTDRRQSRRSVLAYLSACKQNAESDCKIKGTTALAQISGCKVDRDATCGPGETGCADCGADSLARLSYRGIRKPHDARCGDPRGNVNLYLDGNSLNADQCG